MKQTTFILLGLIATLALVFLGTEATNSAICMENRTVKRWHVQPKHFTTITCRGVVSLCIWTGSYYDAQYSANICCDKRKTYPYCDIPVCPDGCSNNMICVDDDKCECVRGGRQDWCPIEKCNLTSDCYPGTCTSDANCQCSSGFSGPNCQIMKEGPVFRKCQVSLIEKNSGKVKYMDRTTCFGKEENPMKNYTNKKNFSHIRIDLEQTYKKLVDVPVLDTTLFRAFEVGIISVQYEIIVRDSDDKIIRNISKDCSQNASQRNPYETIHCYIDYDLNREINHGQRLEIVLKGETGGFKEVRKEKSSSEYEVRNISGQRGIRIANFMFDLQPPCHCSEGHNCWKCNTSCDKNVYLPLSAVKDVTNVPDVKILFLGWSDNDSFLYEYQYSVYRMSLNGEGKLQEDEEPVFTNIIGLIEKKSEDQFKLNTPGMYSIIGKVFDYAGNFRYCRALVLYTDKTMTVVKTNKTMTVISSTNTINRTHWLTSSMSSITISWKDVFANPTLNNNQWLAEIKKLPYKDIIDYDYGNISVHGTPNKAGITKFQYQYKETISLPVTRNRHSLDATGIWMDVEGDISDNVTLRNIYQDNGVTFWIKAEDISGNHITDYIYIRTDLTKPEVSSPIFVKNVTGPKRGYFSRIDVNVSDHESGVFQLNYSIYSITGNSKDFIGSGSQNAVECLQESSCFCTMFEECFLRKQAVFINNCIFVKYMGIKARIELDIYNMALLRESKQINLGNITGLSGVNEYPPPSDLRVKRSFGTRVVLTWYLPYACYKIENIYVNLKEHDDASQTLYGVHTETELLSLVPNTMYTAEVYIVYEHLQKSQHAIHSFNTGPPLNVHPDLSPAAITGIAIAILLLTAIIVIVILIVVRVKLRNQPPLPQSVTKFGDRVRNRLSMISDLKNHLSSEHVTTVNVAYKVGNFDDDIYAYGEMDTDPDANWKHSSDVVNIGRVLCAGRFAEIRIGTLSSKEGTRSVAVKMLKDHTEDNVLLMKAKMNFLATAVPHHNNIVNFVGAITEDPLILLEYCNMSIKEWLQSIDKITDDVEDNMINFCTDIARGMKHLHDNQILHRRLGVRNVLIKDVQMMGRLVAKITGFGPMKGETLGDTGHERIPIKWMAPEQLGLGKTCKRPYTKETDVWSYGITVWEIYSKGQNPFAKEKHSEIKGILERGIRPSRPDDCPEELYDEVMLKCWQQKPNKRPSFSEVSLCLEKLFDAAPDGDEYYDDQYGPNDTVINMYNCSTAYK